ncbi:PQQ-binding-like beta-propeller repeat protein [Leptothrix ochracea]|uniref:PQQ-binding-like beta-propeller repeat protein n=1 Tax=Leptothrix ochracea TaxID=735331 RepID=UPI0034E2BFEF
MTCFANAKAVLTRAAALLGLLGWAACAGVGLVGCGSAPPPEPTALEPFKPRMTGQQMWSSSLGPLVPGQTVAVVGERFVLATLAGDLITLDATTGLQRERVRVGAPIAAGVGSDGVYSAVVTRDNELVVVAAGAIRWKTRLNMRVVTPPLVAGERVFVQGVQRTVEAFDAQDGRKLWSFQRPATDALALAQTGVLTAYQNTLLVGVGPRLVALDPLLGSVRAEHVMATPRGTNEVERLADLVGPAGRSGDVVCVRAFQSSVGCVDMARSNLLWSRAHAGFQGLAADSDFVFGATTTDRLTAWRQPTGDVVWSTERFRYRGLSAPLLFDRTVVLGDAQGWIHFLSRDKGETLFRWFTDASGVMAPPVRAAKNVLVLTRAGNAYGLRVE